MTNEHIKREQRVRTYVRLGDKNKELIKKEVPQNGPACNRFKMQLSQVSAALICTVRYCYFVCALS